MSKQSKNQFERLEFDELRKGDIVHITTGLDDEAYRYKFIVREPGEQPKGQFEETRPDGTNSGQFLMYLAGCGQWTTRQENPVQKQERALTCYWEGLIAGDFLITVPVLDDASLGERLVFDRPRQEISQITIDKS